MKPTKMANRMGQRQRKKRLQKRGVLDENEILQSIGKKERKFGKIDETKMGKSTSGLDSTKNVGVKDIVTVGEVWKDEGKAHPSWAARQAQKKKSGIGLFEFKGDKITFDYPSQSDLLFIPKSSKMSVSDLCVDEWFRNKLILQEHHKCMRNNYIYVIKKNSMIPCISASTKNKIEGNFEEQMTFILRGIRMTTNCSNVSTNFAQK